MVAEPPSSAPLGSVGDMKDHQNTQAQKTQRGRTMTPDMTMRRMRAQSVTNNRYQPYDRDGTENPDAVHPRDLNQWYEPDPKQTPMMVPRRLVGKQGVAFPFGLSHGET